MKFKLDENMPERLVRVLISMGFDADTTTDEGLVGQPDPVLWNACIREGRFLLTQDKDFADVRRFRPTRNSGVLVLRLNNPSRVELIRRVLEILNTVDVKSLQGKTVAATKNKLRFNTAAERE